MKTWRRSDTLWEGRHKSSLVQSERYLLACSRYIEMNPVVANMVSKPEQYRWSSYMCNAWGENGLLQPHEQQNKIATSPFLLTCTGIRSN
ncbi:MAG: hypothetical protein LJE83_14440 [Gammaproteobacteria bacterium]|nr:hypothetical protein [Gammaproteobacteria bacterium]